ncbi:response regulator [Dyadobacter chenwenxiniae]|uniref:Response regulator n=1 Tax=Dyadobacter chenwenxiniae TaxID=2906456 RepID=A0A9X1PG88_9BACT|nr:response regulator [Dyadobacter chenwenxiniae]MCF0052847.1 response regulator [Dyadobacter chenwenxiniae]MCF0060158.1 response regulator [Dyadobacter chenwenxiniae]UON85895.1 response regulator [Dyadobacter chenwenxiniae]
MDNKEIYLVDDSADHRYLVRTIFNKFLPNYHVRFFQGGNELYQFLILQSAPSYTGRRPGLIIMDLKMPSINGLELLKLIRQTPDNGVTQWKTMPIVILSNNSSNEITTRCYLAGANSFFMKPVEFEELRYMLETICHYWMDYNKLPAVSPTESQQKPTALDLDE